MKKQTNRKPIEEILEEMLPRIKGAAGWAAAAEALAGADRNDLPKPPGVPVIPPGKGPGLGF